MARPIKEGFDYFPFDVNLDRKIQAIESVFKNDGLVWIIKFWQTAYQNNIGEISLDGYHGVIQAENSRITIDKQNEIIKMCLEIGLIYKTEAGLYTSNGIKKRMRFLLTERERWRNKNKNELSTGIISGITTGEGGKVKESKVNESKENKTKEKEITTPEHRICSELLLNRILERRQIKTDEYLLKKWDNEIRLMVERDKRTLEQINQLINECHDMQPSASGFSWRDNILSMSKLREKWNEGKIYIGMNSNKKGGINATAGNEHLEQIKRLENRANAL